MTILYIACTAGTGWDHGKLRGYNTDFGLFKACPKDGDGNSICSAYTKVPSWMTTSRALTVLACIFIILSILLAVGNLFVPNIIRRFFTPISLTVAVLFMFAGVGTYGQNHLYIGIDNGDLSFGWSFILAIIASILALPLIVFGLFIDFRDPVKP